MAIPEKLYYSLSEVSEMTDIEAYTLRYWEKEFPKLKPKKSKKPIPNFKEGKSSFKRKEKKKKKKKKEGAKKFWPKKG